MKIEGIDCAQFGQQMQMVTQVDMHYLSMDSQTAAQKGIALPRFSFLKLDGKNNILCECILLKLQLTEHVCLFNS